MSARAEAHPVRIRPALARPVPAHRGHLGSVRLTARAGVLLMIVLILTAFGVAPLRAYLGQRSQLAQLDREASQLEHQNAKLQQQIAQLNDPAYLEQLARQCLGMVRPGETAFVVVPKHGTRTPPRC